MALPPGYVVHDVERLPAAVFMPTARRRRTSMLMSMKARRFPRAGRYSLPSYGVK